MSEAGACDLCGLDVGVKRAYADWKVAVPPATVFCVCNLANKTAFNALDVGAVGVLNALITGHLQSGGVAVLTSHQPLALTNVQVLAL